ncbi:MAG: hypothetical protein ACXAC7_05165 [Candidatus Hodarchaeales archaeon]|jgi:hypothetical protein
MGNNVRDLFRKKGKKLTLDEENSKEKSRTLMREFMDKSTKDLGLLPIPELEKKFLQLKLSLDIPQLSNKSSNIDYGKQKQSIETLSISMLSFGLNYQRYYGHGIKKVDHFLNKFKEAFPQFNSISKVQYEQSIEFLNDQQLLFLFEPNKEILFESPETANDIHQILQFVNKDGSVSKLMLISKLKWSKEKIQSRIEILENSGLVLVDEDHLWFPQLAK